MADISIIDIRTLLEEYADAYQRQDLFALCELYDENAQLTRENSHYITVFGNSAIRAHFAGLFEDPRHVESFEDPTIIEINPQLSRSGGGPCVTVFFQYRTSVEGGDLKRGCFIVERQCECLVILVDNEIIASARYARDKIAQSYVNLFNRC